MSDRFFIGLRDYIKVDKTKLTDREKLNLNEKVLSISFESYKAKNEFNQIVKTEQNDYINYLKFNRNGNITQKKQIERTNEIRNFSIYEYDENNNLINHYSGSNEFVEKTPEYIYLSYSYDENGNLSKQYNYSKYGKKCEKYEYKYWLYNGNLLIEEKSINRDNIKLQYNENNQLIFKEELAHSYDGQSLKTTTKYYYNSKNLLIKKAKHIVSNGLTDYITTYEYDELDNIIEIKTIEPSSPPIKYIDKTLQNHDNETTFIYSAKAETMLYQELNRFDMHSNLISQTVHNTQKETYKHSTFKYENNLLIEQSDFNKLGEKTNVTIREYTNKNKILKQKNFSKNHNTFSKQYEYDKSDNLIKITHFENNEVKYIKEMTTEYY